MSDWDVDELSLDAWVTDLETVVDAAGVERFPLLGISQGGAVAVAYAVRHPERVSHLILYGGFALGGKKRAPAEKEMRDAMMTLMRLGWGADSPGFRQMFTGLFIPGGTHEQADFFNELQRKTTSPECAARYFDVVGRYRHHRSSRQSDGADSRNARARRSGGSVRSRPPVGCRHSRRPLHCLARAKTICSWSMSRLPSDSSRRSGFSWAADRLPLVDQRGSLSTAFADIVALSSTRISGKSLR